MERVSALRARLSASSTVCVCVCACSQVERRYYASSWHGSSSAVLAFSLVQALGKTSNEQLWLAVTGLTDQLVHERILFQKCVRDRSTIRRSVLQIGLLASSDSNASRCARTRSCM
eukprot:932476-Pleurochrysis_carterae.AAC.1